MTRRAIFEEWARDMGLTFETDRKESGMRETGIVWEEPPFVPHAAAVYTVLLGEVARRPGQWAMIRDFSDTKSGKKMASGRANDLRRGKIAREWEGQFEYKAALGKVYARYIGQNGNGASGETPHRVGATPLVAQSDESDQTLTVRQDGLTS